MINHPNSAPNDVPIIHPYELPESPSSIVAHPNEPEFEAEEPSSPDVGATASLRASDGMRREALLAPQEQLQPPVPP